ncbi:hypothetical protein FB45DRAFT_1036022 [Roridomyces roridus]|uniref:Uncharacterized protein n=1 Tax=Roridomyces roridus TaxID=1738132 RepID=A0AAD7B9E0_9AGAR|nr:hypothetical protein FB45DRAFT_1036022 [Roridomyces roridus]
MRSSRSLARIPTFESWSSSRREKSLLALTHTGTVLVPLVVRVVIILDLWTRGRIFSRFTRLREASVNGSHQDHIHPCRAHSLYKLVTALTLRVQSQFRCFAVETVGFFPLRDSLFRQTCLKGFDLESTAQLHALIEYFAALLKGIEGFNQNPQGRYDRLFIIPQAVRLNLNDL